MSSSRVTANSLRGRMDAAVQAVEIELVDLTGDEAEQDKAVIRLRRTSCTSRATKYKCPVPGCEKNFRTEQHLKRHQLTHTKIKRYRCHVCQVKFSQRPQLTLHQRIHSGEEPFDCATCKKKFHRKDKYNDHMRRMHPAKVIIL